MRKSIFNDSVPKGRKKTRRWLGWVTFCSLLLVGQIGFAFLVSNLKSNVSGNVETFTEFIESNNNTLSTSSESSVEDVDDEPLYCSQISESSGTGTSWALGGPTNQSLAADFIVFEGTTFNIQQVKVNVTGTATYFNVIFFADNGGVPGPVVSSFSNVPIIGSIPNGGITQHTLDLSAEDVSFSSSTGDIKYWMQIQSDASGWENRVGSQIGGKDAYLNDTTEGWTIINAGGGNNDLVYELIGECIGSCLPPTAPTATYTDATNVVLSWLGEGTLFDVEWGLAGFTIGSGTQINDIATNSINITVLPQTPYEFYVRQDCGENGVSSWIGPFAFQTGYCEAFTQWTGDNINSFVTTGAIVNISNTNNGGSPSGYGNFTDYAVQHFATGEVEFTVINDWNMNVNIWIDWNNNMVFDSDELVYEGWSQQTTHTVLITVPAGTPVGDYRIRIRGGYSWAMGWGSPCGLMEYGETEDYTFTVIPPPTCMPPTQLGANINTLTEAELYWTSEGTLFEVEYGLQGFSVGTGTQVTGITDTSVILSDLTPNTYYHYYVRRDCGDGDLSPWAGPYTFYTNYCEAFTQWTGDNINSFVTTGAIVNISNTGNGGSPNGYGNFTNYAVQHFATGEVEFTVTNDWSMSVNIWIDWNNNMVFEPDELVYEGWSEQTTHTVLITVPADTPIGDYRIRIRGGYTWATGWGSPCGTISNGETEDYTFTVITPPTCMPPTQLGANINTLTEAELYWTSEGTLFEVEYGMQGFSVGTGTQVTGITDTSVILSDLTPNTYYQYFVRRDCGDGDLSPWTGPYTFYTNYCEALTQWTGDNINSFVTTGAIVNISNTGNGGSPNGYGNFTNYAVQHFATGEVEFTVTNDWSMSVNIWIDWNNNMVFEPDELVYEGWSEQTTHTVLITVPADTPIGDYRIRIRGGYTWATGWGSPCGTISNGETEDYTFTVITPPTCMPPTQLGANINTLTEAELYWTSEGTLFEVEYGMQGFSVGTGTQVTGITDTSVILSDLTPNTYYQYFVRRDCGDGDLSPWTGPYTFYTNYCEALTQWTGDNINSFVTTGAIVNISNTNNGGSPSGYGNFTDYAVQHFATGEVEFTVINDWNMNVNIWIDWNNNMVFDSDELVYEGWSQQTTHTVLITVPAGTPVGDYRIRIRGGYSWATGWGSPCGTMQNGETEDYTFTVITPPTCMPPTQLGANLNTFTEAELYWTSEGTLFEVEYGLQGFSVGTGTQVTGITDTSVILSDLTPNTYYHYYVRRDCGDGDLSPWAGPYTFYTNYCEAFTQWTGDNINSFVTTGAIVNISNTGNGGSPNGYGNFTNYAVQHFATGEVEFTVTNDWSMSVNIWIDWNNNMVFEPDELVYEGWSEQTTHTVLITVPAGTPVGDYRIRIRGGYSWAPGWGSPCGTMQNGETEDYTFTVITPPTCMPPTQLGANINTLTEAELYWTSEGTLFEVEYGMQGFSVGTGTQVTGITDTSVILSDLTPNTYYQYFVRRDCGDGDLSPWAGPYTFYTNYCEALTQWTGDNINSFVTTGAIVNIYNTNNGGSPNGYGNFTNYAVQHFATGEVEFTVTNDWSMNVNIWIDWNNNMVFEPDELVYEGWSQQTTHTVLITVPAGTPVGDYRIRIRGGYSWATGWGSPCGTMQNGETEDYTFTVITPPTCMPPTQLGANINTLTEAELYWTSEGTLFEVEYGMQGFSVGTGTQVTGITDTSVILSDLTPNTYYQYFVRRDCGDGDLSPWTGPYTFYTNYCEALTQWTGNNITSFVTTGGIPYDISNYTEGSAGGYGNYTSMSVHHFETGQIDYEITTNWTGLNVKMWIDWNNNMVFDTDELVAQTYTGSILIPLGTPIGDYRIRIRASSDSDFGPCGTISNGETEDYTLTVITPPSCLPAFKPMATNISATSVSLSWQADGELFDIEYGPAGFTPGTGTMIYGVGNPYVLSGLESGVDYAYYVRQDCGEEDGVSTWNGPVIFTPGIYQGDIPSLLNANPQVEDDACATSFSIDVPEGYYLSALNVQYIMISWNTAFQSHQRSVLYSPTLNMGESEVVAGTVDFPGMVTYNRDVDFANGATGTIEFQLKAWRTENGSGCSTDHVYVVDGSWILTPEFTLIPTCPEPTDLSYANPTLDSVDLMWTGEDGAMYDIQWGLPGFAPEDIEGTLITDLSSTSYTLSGLDSSIVYEFYVRRNCSSDDGSDYSAWIGPVKFNSGHCIPSSQYNHYISTFLTTNGEANISYYSTSINGSGYGDNTAMVVSDLAGESFNFSLNYVGGGSGLRIWVDWNSDYIFDSSEEVFYLANASGNKTGVITIPTDVLPGDYVMRVRVEFGASASPQACGHIEYGEALDFTLHVATVCEGVATPTGETAQTLTEGQTLADLVVGGANLTWYSDASLTEEVPATTEAVDGTTYYVTQTIDGCESEALAIYVEVTLSTDRFDEASFRAYPNPVRDILNISYSKDISEVAVINMLGQVVISEQVSATDAKVDMSGLPTGNYLVKVTVDGTVKTIKVVKQ